MFVDFKDHLTNPFKVALSSLINYLKKYFKKLANKFHNKCFL